ncbi:MAG: MMPL family transporter, partial [Planctomycetaceae bacterium]
MSRRWPWILAGWVALSAAVHLAAPAWDDVVRDGSFGFMPAEMPSRQGERLFEAAFSKDLLGSTVVLVIRRTTSDEGLTESDLNFIDDGLEGDDDPRPGDELKEWIEQIAREEGGLAGEESVAVTGAEDRS